MIALLLFSVLAAAAVWLAGRKDPALDPRLTTVVLALLGVFPVLLVVIPKLIVIPQPVAEAQAPSWKVWLAVVWISGFLVEVVRLLAAWRKVRGWAEGSTLLETVEGVEIRSLSGLRGPVAAGVREQIVFVPGDWLVWEEDLRKMALCHELEHHRRRDPLRRWIAGIAVAVNWFNPLVRWIVRRLLIQCEYSCDATVIRSGVESRRYAKALCDLAEDRPLKGPALAMAERGGLEARVRRVMEPQRGDSGLASGVLILLAVGAAALLALVGQETITGYTKTEIHQRRTADPFPGL
ncbi:M56 family metallopeptidase [Luteolibacter sp. SL250]|uniref:M56 family metallopeptidase n=1 Tax=Luteolibacter sp. SL250 TaxID=2995170 RepID=UPI002271CF09|nr:M56 family metallopeptidase [Luteolibacter sp. SL250]WAC18230.1 M56 family metallopeptidase [Luteolibacter sp. SL250]